jgi:Holliday junction resolvase RusA-like endonuclease
MLKFTISGELPDLNTYIRECRRNKYAGNKMKQDTQEAIQYRLRAQYSIRQQITRPVTIRFIWVCKNARKDIDNVAFAKKFILDALVNLQILPDDSRKWVIGFSDEFPIDKDNPRIEIYITEITS